jgi:hypothetical protein
MGFFIRVNARPFDNPVAETLLPAYYSPQHPSYLGIFNLAQPPTGAPTIPPIFYGTYHLLLSHYFNHIFQYLPLHRAQSSVYLEIDHGFDPVEETLSTDPEYENI